MLAQTKIKKRGFGGGGGNESVTQLFHGYIRIALRAPRAWSKTDKHEKKVQEPPERKKKRKEEKRKSSQTENTTNLQEEDGNRPSSSSDCQTRQPSRAQLDGDEEDRNDTSQKRIGDTGNQRNERDRQVTPDGSGDEFPQ